MPKTGTPPTPERLFTGWHTSVFDGYTHAITNTAFTEDVRQRHGQCETVCGLVICLTASVAPSGRTCPRCAPLLRTRPTPHPPADNKPRHRRIGWPHRVSGRHTRGVSA